MCVCVSKVERERAVFMVLWEQVDEINCSTNMTYFP